METDGTGDPLVSVVLPTYDRPEMLAEAVESVATQQYSAVELVVVDDASPTPVEEVVAEAAPPELRWRCLRHESNRGANAARNTGIEAAEGDIVAFLDDDDRWKPEKLDAQVSAFRERGDDVGVVLVGQQFVDHGREAVTRMPDVEGNATPELMTDGIGGSFSTIAVGRSVVEEAGLPDERLPAWQDREWLVRLSCHCEFATVQRPLVVRRVGEYDQIGDSFEPKRDVTYPLFLEKHSDLAAEYGLESRFEAWLSCGIASEGLANGYYRDARRFAARAIRTDPLLTTAYIYLALALGGRYTYNAAVRLKRAFD
ncbi:glycosyltransferase [Halorussus salilacus]|uniref:glycosyltransferase family 2 protein n=1 Tax=Halorussus salilacus TaxID=2953750 RepID=UPI0020A00E15|nr:glycosyltransferase family 2 protein [Halorussus salilacus]USZ67224.1 glycosyltransferase [Halorussus salilacus]